MFGYQWPHTGNAYAGIVSFSFFNSNYREIIGSSLVTPLIVGQKYYFSFFANFSFDPLSIGIASNNIGLRFSTVFYSEFNAAPTNNFAHLNLDSILSDSVNWHFISGSFIADSSYNYFAIANFFLDSLTDTIHVGNAFPDYTYYYIDDVCVTSDSLYNQTWTGLEGINNFQNDILFFPNPTSDYLSVKSKSPINSFKIIDAIGKTVISMEKLNDFEYKIYLLNVNSGIYFLQLKTQEKNVCSIISVIH